MTFPWIIFIIAPLFAIDVHGKKINSFLGSTVRLLCNSNTSRTVWYGPYGGESEYARSGVKSDIFPKEIGERIFTFGNELHIVNVQPGDEGRYKCSNGDVNSEFDLKLPALVYSRDKEYFRHLEIDIMMQKLMVGSMNTLTVINLSTPMNTPTGRNKMSEVILPKPSNVEDCVLSHSKIPYCQNHIRLLAKKSDEIWIACGTNGDSPTGYEFNVTAGSYIDTGNVPCSNDPFHHSTAVYVEPLLSSGRPYMYYGSVYYSDSTVQRPIYDSAGFVREYMKGVDSNNWMNDPEFLGSFELKETVLFFFREEAVEVGPSEPKIYSRVAKVCKKDKGGNTQLRDKWTSFQKARLTCSIPGKYPFYLDILQDVVTVDNVTFYALFTASSVISYSAICAFSLSDIEQAFNEGKFKFRPDSSSYWKPVQKVPNPRPGQCIDNSLTLPDTTLEFIANTPLMNQIVRPQTGKPLFVLEKENLQQVELHRNTTELIFYVSSNRGNIYKLFLKNSEMHIVSSYAAKRFGTSDDVIWSMKQFGDYVYIGTDNSVQAIQIINCEQHRSVSTCIKDPHCAWINNTYSIPVDQCYNRCRSLTYVTENGYLEFSYTHTNSDLSYLSQLLFTEEPLPTTKCDDKTDSQVEDEAERATPKTTSSYEIQTTKQYDVLSTKGQTPVKAAQTSQKGDSQELWKQLFIAGIIIGCLYYLGIAIVLLTAEMRKKYAKKYVLVDDLKAAENGGEYAHKCVPVDDLKAEENGNNSTTIPLLEIKHGGKTDNQTADKSEQSTPKTTVGDSETI